MLNPVSHAITEINQVIPPQILQFAFKNEIYKTWKRQAPQSIDEMIKSKVIRRRVIKDADLTGGREALVLIDGLQGLAQDDYSIVYNIPPERTGNREIMTVLNVTYSPEIATVGNTGTPFGVVTTNTNSDISVAGQRVLDSFGSVPHISSASVELIGYNTVIITDSLRSTSLYALRCILSNEENLSNLSPRSYRSFAKMCVLAVKAYIYNYFIITIDQGILEQGQNVGEFKTIIDKYEGAEEEYQNYLTNVFTKVLMMNDAGAHQRFINAQLNPGL